MLHWLSSYTCIWTNHLTQASLTVHLCSWNPSKRHPKSTNLCGHKKKGSSWKFEKVPLLQKHQIIKIMHNCSPICYLKAVCLCVSCLNFCWFGSPLCSTVSYTVSFTSVHPSCVGSPKIPILSALCFTVNLLAAVSFRSECIGRSLGLPCKAYADQMWADLRFKVGRCWLWFILPWLHDT